MPVVIAGGQAEWPLLASFDEAQDIRNRRIFARQGLNGGESLCEDAGPVKQLFRPPILADRDPMVVIAGDRLRIAGAAQREQNRWDAARCK